MNDSDSQSHWNALASEIGADVPKPQEKQEEVVEVTEKITEESETPKSATKETQSKPRKTRSTPQALPPSDWAAVASDLGIEVAPEVFPEVTTEPEVTEASSGPAVTEPFPDVSQVAPETIEAPPVIVAAKQIEQPASESETVDSSFGDDVFESESAADPLANFESKESIFDSSESETQKEPEQDETRRPRRRRRRGRGRGRSSASSSETDQKSDEGTADANAATTAGREVESDTTKRPRRSENRQTSGDSELNDDDEGSTPRKKHRNIPTWEEVMGSVVDRNMNSRSTPKPEGRRRRGGRRRSEDKK